MPKRHTLPALGLTPVQIKRGIRRLRSKEKVFLFLLATLHSCHGGSADFCDSHKGKLTKYRVGQLDQQPFDRTGNNNNCAVFDQHFFMPD